MQTTQTALHKNSEMPWTLELKDFTDWLTIPPKNDLTSDSFENLWETFPIKDTFLSWFSALWGKKKSYGLFSNFFFPEEEILKQQSSRPWL